MEIIYFKSLYKICLRIILILIYPLWVVLVFVIGVDNFEDFLEGVKFPFEKW